MKRSIIIRLVVIGVVVMFGFLVLEIKETSDLNYTIKYNYYSNEPYGLQVFHKALVHRFGEENVIYINYLDSLPVSNASKSAFVCIAEEINLDYDQYSIITDFMESGGKSLFATEDFGYLGDEYVLTNSGELNKNHEYDLDFSGNFHRFSDIYSDEDSLRMGHVVREFSFTEEEIDVDTSEYTKEDSFDIASSDSDYRIDELVLIDEIAAVKMYDSTFIFHGFPVLFTNIGVSQSYYAVHFNLIFDHLQADRIYVLQQGIVGADTSLLKVILGDRGLRSAFFILLLSILLLLLFNIKRIQAPIPLIIPYKNRTIDYLQTLSFLYQKADKPFKLAVQMKTNFYQYVHKEFNLKENHSDFVTNLSRKTKVEPHFIDSIVKDLALFTKGIYFEPQKLIVTHNKIKSFKDRIHGNRGTGRK